MSNMCKLADYDVPLCLTARNDY